MPKASEVATGLRKLADALDRNPDLTIIRPRIGFWYDTQKDAFVETCRLLPRPLVKKFPKATGAWERVYVEHDNAVIEVFATIYQSNFCHLVTPAQPAVYECDSILSPEDEKDMGVSA